jgi:hypothetical protein
MRSNITMGPVVPQSADRIPPECAQMYPGVKIIPRSVGQS